MRQVVMEDGKIYCKFPSLDDMADRAAGQLKHVPDGHAEVQNPHIYKVLPSAADLIS